MMYIEMEAVLFYFILFGVEIETFNFDQYNGFNLGRKLATLNYTEDFLVGSSSP